MLLAAVTLMQGILVLLTVLLLAATAWGSAQKKVLNMVVSTVLAVELQTPRSTAENLLFLAFKALSQMLIIRDIFSLCLIINF